MDYPKIREEFESSTLSFKKLSEKYKIHYKKLERTAKKYKWKRGGVTPLILVEDEKNELVEEKPKIEELKEEKELYEYLEKLVITPLDRVLVNSYFNSYKIFKALEKDLNLEDINQNETIRMQQLQIERNNLIKLGKDIQLLYYKNQNLKGRGW